MFVVETYATVRRFVFVQEKSRREAARVFGLSRETIAKMCRYSARLTMCGPRGLKSQSAEPLISVIDAIRESDKTAPPNQAKRIFERLRIEHGFLDGYTPLSLTIIFGLPRSTMRRDNSRATRKPESEVSATSARHSRVQSSTIARMRKRRPSVNWSETKSRLQRSLGASGIIIGALVVQSLRCEACALSR
jgi:hypothetical protein